MTQSAEQKQEFDPRLPEDALKVLEVVTGTVKASRGEHIGIQVALNTLRSLIEQVENSKTAEKEQ